MKYFFIPFFIVFILSCKSDQKSVLQTGDSVINKSIEISNAKSLNNAKMSFVFRGNRYLAERDNGRFVLARFMVSETKDSIFDVLSNDGFERFVNDEQIMLPDSLMAKFSASVNSVHYFSVLPYGLNDKAVFKTLLGEESIKQQNYFKVLVTFSEEGGGEDFEDEFVYWINSETFKIEYLAYSYAEDDGQGLRFREAYNERMISGIRIVDYSNYKPTKEDVPLESLGLLFNKDNLELLSKIELENVQIDLINDL